MVDLNSIYAKKAMKLFEGGCNCSQSVFCAFEEATGISHNTALSISSGFGGGMGRLRRSCGALTGGIMVIGALTGYTDTADDSKKAELYKRVQAFVNEFEKELGTSLCSELLNTTDNSPVPTKRTESFYKERPCKRIIGVAACILEKLFLN